MNDTSVAALIGIRSMPIGLYATLVASVLSIGFGHVKAAVINARSVSLVDVSSAIDSAHEGDTVVVPQGTASWTSMLTIAKGITLQGAGKDETVIFDDLPRLERREPGREQRQPEESRQRQPEEIRQRQLERQRQQQLQGPRPAPPFGGSRPLPDRAGPQGGRNPGIMKVDLTPSQTFRLTGFTFRYGSLTSNSEGAIRLSGTCQSIRVDHCHFDQLYTDHNVEILGWLYGVIDHCTFDIVKHGGATAYVLHNSWGNQPSGWGSWADPPYFGSEKFIFFEDNVINNLGPAPNHGSIDAARGGRYVARHNTFNNCNIFYHGSDSGAGGVYLRGTRAVEIYNNTFNTSLPNHAAGQNRGGSLLWHHNTYTGTFRGGMVLRIYRQFEGGAMNRPGGWGSAANGTNPWDHNATEPDGTHVDGHAPYLYVTGTHIGGNDSSVVTVSGTPWQPNQWAGYSVTNTSSTSPYFNGCNYISSNTSNTLTLAPITGKPPLPKFNTRDTFAVRKVLIVLDQPGRGRGDLIVGNPSGTTNLTGTAWPAWPHQALEPCYSWDNTLNGSSIGFANNDLHNILRENVDYYNNTPMPRYTPYTYPHPLTTVNTKAKPALGSKAGQ